MSGVMTKLPLAWLSGFVVTLPILTPLGLLVLYGYVTSIQPPNLHGIMNMIHITIFAVFGITFLVPTALVVSLVSGDNTVDLLRDAIRNALSEEL